MKYNIGNDAPIRQHIILVGPQNVYEKIFLKTVKVIEIKLFC